MCANPICNDQNTRHESILTPARHQRRRRQTTGRGHSEGVDAPATQAATKLRQHPRRPDHMPKNQPSAAVYVHLGHRPMP